MEKEEEEEDEGKKKSYNFGSQIQSPSVPCRINKRKVE